MAARQSKTIQPSKKRFPHLFADLASTRWISAKGLLFLFLGCLSGVVLIIRLEKWSDVALLAICIWSFCRAYYFAFYVIQHWIDPEFKFSGLGSFAAYLLRKSSR